MRAHSAARADEIVADHLDGGQEGWCGMCRQPLKTHFSVKGSAPVWKGCPAPEAKAKTFLLVVDRRQGPERTAEVVTSPALPVRKPTPARAHLVYTLRAPQKQVTIKLSKGRADAYQALKQIKRPASVQEVAHVARHPKETTQQFLHWLWKRRIAKRTREEQTDGTAVAV